MVKALYSGIVLAGGESKRFNGTNKAMMEVGGQRNIDRLLKVIRPFFDEIILVAADPVIYLNLDLLVVSDHFDCRSSLTGIHAGLFAAKHTHAMVMGCDMPFLQPALLSYLLQEVEPQWDVVIPKTRWGFEPLMATYSKRCIAPIEKNLVAGKYQIQRFFKHVRMKTIAEDQLRCHDPDLASIFNVNSPTELARAEAWLKGQGDLHEP